MSDGFEFYQGRKTESAERARITVRRGGILVLTQAATEMLGDGVERVQIGFNPKTRAVGLRAVPNDHQGGYRLRAQGKSRSFLVDGKRLFAHHGLPAEKARTYDAEAFGADVVGLVLPDDASAKPKSKDGSKKAAK